MRTVAHLLVHNTTIKREVQTSQGRGRFTDVPTVIATGVACRISTPSASERVQAEQMKTFVSHVAFFNPTQDVKRGDTLFPTSAPWSGSQFRVTGIADPSIAHHRKALLELIQQGS